MPLDEIPEGAGEGGHVERAKEPPPSGYRVRRRARLELVEEPQPLLSERERELELGGPIGRPHGHGRRVEQRQLRIGGIGVSRDVGPAAIRAQPRHDLGLASGELRAQHVGQRAPGRAAAQTVAVGRELDAERTEVSDELGRGHAVT